MGKHTAARELSRSTGAPVLNLGREAAACARDGEVDVRDLLKRVLPIPPASIVVGHLAPYVAPPECRAAVLRRDPRELRGIYRQRGYDDAKSDENCAAEILGVTAHDALERFGRRTVQIDVTRRPPAEVARMAAEAEPPGDDVDWLSEVAGRGELASFFPTC